MFIVLLRGTSRSVRGSIPRLAISRSQAQLLANRLSIRGISGHNDLQSELAETAPSSLKQFWSNAFDQDATKALSVRFDLYDKLRTYGLHSVDPQWCISLLDSIPKESIRLTDISFTVEVLVTQKDWEALRTLLDDVSKKLPTVWEKMMFRVLGEFPDVPAKVSLTLLGEGSTNQEVNMMSIKRDSDFPAIQMFRSVIKCYSVSEIVEALDQIFEENSIIANSLATGLLRTNSDALIDKIKPPTPLEGNYNAFASAEDGDLTDSLWNWKADKKLVLVGDLQLYMINLVYRRKSMLALSVYDNFPSFHGDYSLNEAVLLAAAGTADYSRLQTVFESVEQDDDLIKRLGSKRYAIVLGTLGYMGDANALRSIYESLRKSKPELLTRGVFHGLMHSSGVRGDVGSVRKYYEFMMTRGITPTYTTFNLVLQAYRDAMDVKGAIVFVGDEMLTRHQYALRNEELTLLLSLCGKRRDHKSAKFIWKWGGSLIKPDRISWNAYLHSLISSNLFSEAWEVLSGMEQENLVGIDTLTIMLNAAGRSGAIVEHTSKLLAIKKELGVAGDDVWYLSLLSALAEWGNLEEFENVLDEMKSLGVRFNASHYALYTEMLTKTKQFEKHEKIVKEMRDHLVPINFAYIEKHFRLLVAPGSSPESRESAHLAALNLVREGFFDPQGAMVPRGAIPVRVIEPVVRRLIKSGEFISAKRLLDGLRKQRVAEAHIRDECSIWALYMEIADASKNFAVIDKLWNEFLRSLPLLFVLSKESDKTGRKPTSKISRRYRYVFWKAVDIWIQHLSRQKAYQEIRSFPYQLERMGLSMNGHNINSFIIALVETGQEESAFKLASAARNHTTFSVSAPAKRALASKLNNVDYNKYGRLGILIRQFAERHSI